METLKSTIKQKKHNHEKTPYVDILQIYNHVLKLIIMQVQNTQNHNIESLIQQMFS